MGGLVARHLIEQRGGSQFVNNLIMCGTPNGGSRFGKMEHVRHLFTLGLTMGVNALIPFQSTIQIAGILGVLKAGKAAAGGSASNQDNPSNRIADLNPEEIESIEIE